MLLLAWQTEGSYSRIREVPTKAPATSLLGRRGFRVLGLWGLGLGFGFYVWGLVLRVSTVNPKP